MSEQMNIELLKSRCAASKLRTPGGSGLTTAVAVVAMAISSSLTQPARASTNLTLNSSNGTILGGVREVSPGQFEFADLQATNYPERSYCVRSP
jgi:hypothetical protein